MPIDDVDDYLSQFATPSTGSATPKKAAPATQPMDDVDDYLGQFGSKPKAPAPAAPQPELFKPANRPVRDRELTAKNKREKSAAELIRAIEGSREQAVGLFQQADRTDGSRVAAGQASPGQMAAPQLDSAGKPIRERDRLRAEAEGALERANMLSQRAKETYGDLIETGLGKDTDPFSNRRWAYAKPKTAGVQLFRNPTVEERAARTTPEKAEASRRQQARIAAERERFQALSPIGQAAERALTEYLSGDPGASPEAKRDLEERRTALGISDELRTGFDSASRLIGTPLRAAARFPRAFAEFADLVPGIVAGMPRELRDKNSYKSALKPYSDVLERSIDALTPIDEKDDSYWAKILSGAGSALGFAAGGAIAKGLKIPVALASPLLGAATEIGSASEEMDAAGIDPNRKDAAIALAGTTGLTEAFGLGRALDKFGLKRPFIEKAFNILEESGQEAFQGYLGNVNAALVGAYDPKRPLSKDVLESAVIGGVIGGGAQALSGLAERLGRRKEKSVGAGATPEAAGNLPVDQPPVPLPSVTPQSGPIPGAPPQISPQGPQAPAAQGAPDGPISPAAAASGPADPNAVRILAPEEKFSLSQRDLRAGTPDTFTVRGPDGSMQQVEALVPKGMRPEIAQIRVEQALQSQAEAPPVPLPPVGPADAMAGAPSPLPGAQGLASGADRLQRIAQANAEQAAQQQAQSPAARKAEEKAAKEAEKVQQRQSLFDEASRQAEESAARIEELSSAGDLTGMQTELRARQRSLKDALKYAPETSEGLRAKAELNREIDGINAQLKEVSRQSKEIARPQNVQAQEASPAARKAEERAAKEIEKAQLRTELFDEANRLAEESSSRVDELTKAGDIPGVQNELRARQRALKDALKYAPETAQGLRAKAQINRDLDTINSRLKETSRQSREKAAPQNLQTSQGGLLDQVRNPEGGVPEVAPVNDPGSNFIRLAAEQRPAKEEGGNLLKAIRRAGGIRDDGDTSGELRRLGMKEAGTSGLMNRKGSTVDRMREMMVGEGLSQADTVAEFYDEIEAAMRADTESRGRREMTEDEFYERQATEPATDNLEFTTEETPAPTRPKTLLEQVEASPGDVDPDDIAYIKQAIDRSMRENPRTYGERTRPGEPGSSGVSLSPYNVLVTNNRPAVERLYQLDLRSDEARGIVDDLRQYSLDNKIELRHLHALLDYVRNFQLDQAKDEDLGGPSAPGNPPPAVAELRESADFVETKEHEVNRDLTEEVRSLPPAQADWLRSSGREIDELLQVLAEDSDMIAARDAAVAGDEAALEEFTELGSAAYGFAEDTLRYHIESRRLADRIDRGTPRETGRGRGETASQAGSPRDNQGRQTPRTDEEGRQSAGRLTDQDFQLLTRNPEQIPDREYDDHLRAVEDLRNQGIRTSLFGGKDLSEGEVRQIDAILRMLNEARSDRTKTGALGAKNEVGKGIFEADLTEATPEKVEKGIAAAEAYLGLSGGTERQRTKYQSFLGRARAELSGRRGEEVRTVRHPDPALDGQPVLGERGDGRVIVANPDNKSGISVVKDLTGEPADYKSSSTQVNLPKDLADKILSFGRRIRDKNLADNGRETEPHITVKYGLLGSESDAVREILEGQGPIRATLGKVSLFENPDFDVVKVDVESPDLARLHEAIKAETPNTESFPEYQPHVTIAYVKKGKGRQFVGDKTFEGQKVEFDRVLFSGREGNREQIPTTDSELQENNGPIKITNDERSSATTSDLQPGDGARGENRALEPGRTSARRGEDRGQLSDVQPGLSRSAQPADRPNARARGESGPGDRRGAGPATEGVRTPGVPGAEGVGRRESASEGAPGAARPAGAELSRPAAGTGRSQTAENLRSDQPGRVDRSASPVSNLLPEEMPLPVAEQVGRVSENAVESNKPKAVRDAEARLAEVAAGRRAGSGGQALLDQAIVTGYDVYKAGMDFASWSAQVLKEVGEAVRPQLQRAWEAIQPQDQKTLGKRIKEITKESDSLDSLADEMSSFADDSDAFPRSALKNPEVKDLVDKANAEAKRFIDETGNKEIADRERQLVESQESIKGLAEKKKQLEAEYKKYDQEREKLLKQDADSDIIDELDEKYQPVSDEIEAIEERLQEAEDLQDELGPQIKAIRADIKTYQKIVDRNLLAYEQDFSDYSEFMQPAGDKILELRKGVADEVRNFADAKQRELDEANTRYEEIESEDDSTPQFVRDAAERLRDVSAGRRAGSGAQALFDQAIVTGYQVYKAGMDFSTWASEVIQQTGNKVRPQLRKAWQALTNDRQAAFAEARERRNKRIESLGERETAKAVRSKELGNRRQELQRDRGILREEAKANQQAGRPIPESLRKSYQEKTRESTKARKDQARNAALRDQAANEAKSLQAGQVEAAKSARADELARKLKDLETERRAIRAEKAEMRKAGKEIPERLTRRQASLDREIEQARKDQARNASLRDQARSSQGQVLGFGAGALQAIGRKNQPIPNQKGLLDWKVKVASASNAEGPDYILEKIDKTVALAEAAAQAGDVQKWNKYARDAMKYARHSVQPSARGRFFEAVGAAQTAGQLVTLGFVTRNILGHGIVAVQSAAGDRVASAIDRAYSRFSGKERTVIGGPANPIKGASEDLKHYREGLQNAEKARKSGFTPGVGAAIELPKASTVVAEKINAINYYINTLPDEGNWSLHFNRSLDSITAADVKAGRTSQEDLLRAIDQAKIEADIATFRDENWVTDVAVTIKKLLNSMSSYVTGTKQFGLGDLIFKYPKVPANIFKTAIDYSPLGLFEAAGHVGKAMQGDRFGRRNATRQLGKVIAGTTFSVGAGVLLGAMGIIVAPEDDDVQSEILEFERGNRDYSFNLSALWRNVASITNGDFKSAGKQQEGDWLVPIGWAAPWAMGAAAGASMYKQASAKNTADALYTTLAKGMQVMGDESVFSGLGDYNKLAVKAGRRAKPGESVEALQAKAIAAKLLEDVPSSFVPGTIRSIGRAADPNVRDYRPEDRGKDFDLGAAFKEGVAKASAGLVPGLSRTFPTRTSVLTGEAKNTAVGELGLPGQLLSLIAPVMPNRFKDDPFVGEILRLNKVNDSAAAKERGEKGAKDLSLYVKPLGEKETEIKGYQEPTSQLRERENAFAKQIAARGKQLVSSPTYRSADDAGKLRMIQSLVDTEQKGTIQNVQPAIEEKRRGLSRAAIEQALRGAGT